MWSKSNSHVFCDLKITSSCTFIFIIKILCCLISRNQFSFFVCLFVLPLLLLLPLLLFSKRLEHFFLNSFKLRFWFNIGFYQVWNSVFCFMWDSDFSRLRIFFLFETFAKTFFVSSKFRFYLLFKLFSALFFSCSCFLNQM